jgi:hypothetical protein
MGIEQLINKLPEQDQLAYRHEIEQAIDKVRGNCQADIKIKRIWDRLRDAESARQ